MKPDAFPEHAAFPIGAHLAVVRRGADRVFVLNPSAGYVWSILPEAGSTEKAAEWLAEDFGVPMETALRDVAAARADWLAQGLTGDPPPPSDLGPTKLAEIPAPWIEASPFIAERHYALHGRRFAIRFHDARFEVEIQSLIGAWETSPGPAEALFDAGRDGEAYVAARDGREIARHDHDRVALSELTDEIARFAHGDGEWLIALHAAALARGEVCALFPALGRGGKSTLAAGLAGLGFAYAGEDLAPIDRATRRALAAPTSIGLREGSWQVLAPLHPGLFDLPLRARGAETVRYLPPPGPRAPARLEARCLIFPRYAPREPFALERVEPADALARLVATGTDLEPPIDSAKIGEVVDWLLSIPIYEMTYEKLDDAAAAVKDLLAP